MCPWRQNLPPLLLPFLRVAYCSDGALLKQDDVAQLVKAGPLVPSTEPQLRLQLQQYLTDRLSKCVSQTAYPCV